MAASLINEVNSAKSFFSLRDSGEPGYALLTKSFADSLVQQINACLRMSTDEATKLIDALKDSPYEDKDLKRILAALDAKVMVLKKAQGLGFASSIKEQVLLKWWLFLTNDDWEFIKNPKRSLHAKMTKLVERANLLGCTNLDEKSKGWMLSMLLCVHYAEIPPANERYEKLQELKKLLVLITSLINDSAMPG